MYFREKYVAIMLIKQNDYSWVWSSGRRKGLCQEVQLYVSSAVDILLRGLQPVRLPMATINKLTTTIAEQSSMLLLTADVL